MACVSALMQDIFLVMLSVIQGAYKEHIMWMGGRFDLTRG